MGHWNDEKQKRETAVLFGVISVLLTNHAPRTQSPRQVNNTSFPKSCFTTSWTRTSAKVLKSWAKRGFFSLSFFSWINKDSKCSSWRMALAMFAAFSETKTTAFNRLLKNKNTCKFQCIGKGVICDVNLKFQSWRLIIFSP